MRVSIGRVGRQMLAVCALSLALVTAVLVLGGYAVSHLGGAPEPAGHAAAAPSGVYRVVTPTPATPFAAAQTRAHKTFVTPPANVALVAFRPAASAPAPATRVPARATTSSKTHASPKKAEKKLARRRARRRAARKQAPARAAQPTAAVASVTPARAVKHANAHSLTRGNSGKPKVTGPRATPPGLSRGQGHGPKPKLLRAAPAPAPTAAPAPAAAPPARGNHGRGKGAIGHGPPPHANNGNGNGNGKGHAGPPPGQLAPKAHGKGH